MRPRLFVRLVTGLLLVGAAVVATSAPALAISAPTFVTPDGTVVTVQPDDKGNQSWNVEISSTAPADAVWGWYVFSWEKSDGGKWSSPEELEAAMSGIVACELDYFNTVISGDAPPPEGEIFDPCISEGPIPATAFERSSTTLNVPHAPGSDGTQTIFGVGMTCNINAQVISGWMSGGVPSVGFCDMDYSSPSYLTVRFDEATPLPDTTARTSTALEANSRPRGVSNSDYASLNPDAAPGSFFAPTVFSGLREFGLPVEEAVRLGTTAGATLVLAALVALPTELINRSLDELRLGGRRSKAQRRDDAESTTEPVRPRGWARVRAILFGKVYGFLAFLILLVASIVASAANTDFGLNWLSLRIASGLFIGFLVINYGATLLGWLVARKSAPGSRPRLAARPVFLIIILVTVIGARLIDIEPTVIFGLILAVDFGVQLSDSATARMAIAESIWMMFVGLCAWGLYLVTAPITAFFGPPVSIAVGEFLAMVCVEALSVLPLILLPASPMPGFELFRWNKWVWGVFFILGLTVFSFVLVPMPSAWSRVNEPFALWVGLFVGYVIVALAVWLVVHLVNRRNARREKEVAKSA